MRGSVGELRVGGGGEREEGAGGDDAVDAHRDRGDGAGVARAPEDAQQGVRADAGQRAADLVLEKNDDRERQVEEDLARDHFERRQVEGAGDEKRAAEDEEADGDLHRARAADERQDVVDDDGDDEDVDEVAPGELQRDEPVPVVHRMASMTLRKSAVSRTSCTRTIAAPARAAAQTAASAPAIRSGPASRPVSRPMNALRDAPIISGAILVSSWARARSCRLCSAVLPKPMPGSTTICSTPAASAASRNSVSSQATSQTTSSKWMSCCIVFSAPRMCIRTAGTLRCATSVRIAGSPRNAVTSLTTSAPASSAAAATRAFVVSIEIATSLRLRIASITGITRSSSIASETGSDPGRVDSPPTSTIAAPSASIRSAASTARSRSKCTPPSEN